MKTAIKWQIEAKILPNRRTNSKWPNGGWNSKRLNNSLMWLSTVLSLFFLCRNFSAKNFLLRNIALVYYYLERIQRLVVRFIHGFRILSWRLIYTSFICIRIRGVQRTQLWIEYWSNFAYYVIPVMSLTCSTPTGKLTDRYRKLSTVSRTS